MRLSSGYHVVCLMALLVLSGCAGGPGVNADTRSTYVVEHPETPANFVPAILSGQVMVGMTESMVLASWGPPSRVETMQGDLQHDSKWVYGNYLASSAVSHLYFKNGRMELFEFLDIVNQQSFQVKDETERLALQSHPPTAKGGSGSTP
ncbi:MAG: hypothetical protein FD129_129 [bacterium]|nr:MAG: hypothetical protein FD129_129 [bacterium]